MTDEERMPQQIEVTMGSRRYRLRGNDPGVLRALAARVDATMGEIAGPDGNKDDFRVAVLAALNLAGDAEDRRTAWLVEARRLAQDANDAASRLARLAETL